MKHGIIILMILLLLKEFVIDDVQIPFFRETMQILSRDGSSIRASAMYEDSGDGAVTTVNTVYFPVECADGKFKDIKIIKFNYFNNYQPNKNVRTLELLM